MWAWPQVEIFQLEVDNFADAQPGTDHECEHRQIAWVVDRHHQMIDRLIVDITRQMLAGPDAVIPPVHRIVPVIVLRFKAEELEETGDGRQAAVNGRCL